MNTGAILLALAGAVLPRIVDFLLEGARPKPRTLPQIQPPWEVQPPGASGGVGGSGFLAEQFVPPYAAFLAEVERSVSNAAQELSRRGVTGPDAVQALHEIRQDAMDKAYEQAMRAQLQKAGLMLQEAELTGRLPGGGWTLPALERLHTMALREAELTGAYSPPFALPGGIPPEELNRIMAAQRRQKFFSDLITNLADVLGPLLFLQLSRSGGK